MSEKPLRKLNAEQQKLARENLGLVFQFAHKSATRQFAAWRRGECSPAGPYNQIVDEFVSAGMIGLLHAAARFNPKLGFKFSTYAVNCIKGYIIRARRDINFSIGTKTNYNQAYTFSDLMRTGDEERSDRNAPGAMDVADMSAPVHEPKWSSIESSLRRGLGRKSAKLLIDKFLVGKTYQEIGAEHGVSKQAAQDRVFRAIDALREKPKIMEELRLVLNDSGYHKASDMPRYIAFPTKFYR